MQNFQRIFTGNPKGENKMKSKIRGVPATTRGIETKDIHQNLDVSQQTLSYWLNKGIVYPSIRRGKKGFTSLWSFYDVLDIKTVIGLRRAGLSLQKIAKVIDWLRNNGHALHSAKLATDGENVWIDLDDVTLEIIEASAGQVICLDWSDIINHCRTLLDEKGIDR